MIGLETVQPGNTAAKKPLSSTLSVYLIKCFSYVVCEDKSKSLELFKRHLNVNVVAIREVRQSIISRLKPSLHERPVWVEPSQYKG